MLLKLILIFFKYLLQVLLEVGVQNSWRNSCASFAPLNLVAWQSQNFSLPQFSHVLNSRLKPPGGGRESLSRGESPLTSCLPWRRKSWRILAVLGSKTCWQRGGNPTRNWFMTSKTYFSQCCVAYVRDRPSGWRSWFLWSGPDLVLLLVGPSCW